MEIEPYKDSEIIIRIFKDIYIDERMYLIQSESEAVVVDPHEDNDALKYLLGVDKVYVMLTHEHYDHISGVNWLRNQFNCFVYATKECNQIINSKENKTAQYPLWFIGDKERFALMKQKVNGTYVCTIDFPFLDKYFVKILDMQWVMWKTPGHTSAGASYLLNNKYLFSGDNLLGDAIELKTLDANEKEYINTLNEYNGLGREVIVFPGHGKIEILSKRIRKVREAYRWN